MNEEQIKKINDDILRLENRGKEILLSPNYDSEFQVELQSYIHGRIDGLKWVKENI